MPGLSRNPENRARQLDGLTANRFVLPSGDHNHSRRCTATSKQAGQRCRNLAAKGTMV